jgi:hypothetical protein
MSNTTIAVRAYRFILQDMAQSTDFLGLKVARATIRNGDILVYMVWFYFQGA